MGSHDRCSSMIFLSMTARETDNVEMAIPTFAASSVSEMPRGTSKYPSIMARLRISCCRGVRWECLGSGAP